MTWRTLDSSDQLKSINDLSHNPNISGVLIFKHSTRCATSSMAVSRMERNWQVSDEKVPAYLLDLINYREISNAITSEYGVAHESPQVIVIKGGKCIFHASHNLITTKAIAESLAVSNK